MEQEGGRVNPRFCSKKLAVEDDWGWNWWLPPGWAGTMSHESSGGRHQIHPPNQVKWIQPNQVIRRSHFGETKPSLFPDFDLFRRRHSAVVIWLFEMGSRPNNTTTVNFEANASTSIKKGLRCSSPSLHISLCHKMPNLAPPARPTQPKTQLKNSVSKHLIVHGPHHRHFCRTPQYFFKCQEVPPQEVLLGVTSFFSALQAIMILFNDMLKFWTECFINLKFWLYQFTRLIGLALHKEAVNAVWKGPPNNYIRQS